MVKVQASGNMLDVFNSPTQHETHFLSSERRDVKQCDYGVKRTASDTGTGAACSQLRVTFYKVKLLTQ